MVQFCTHFLPNSDRRLGETPVHLASKTTALAAGSWSSEVALLLVSPRNMGKKSRKENRRNQVAKAKTLKKTTTLTTTAPDPLRELRNAAKLGWHTVLTHEANRVVDTTEGHPERLQIWDGLSAERQLELLTVSRNRLVQVVEVIVPGFAKVAGPPPGKGIEKIQALFLASMVKLHSDPEIDRKMRETGFLPRGTVNMQEPMTMLSFAVFSELQNRLAEEEVRTNIVRSCFCVLLYIFWKLPFWWLTLPCCLFITADSSSPISQEIRSQFSSGCVSLLCQHNFLKNVHWDAELTRWTAEAYIAATLLLLLVKEPTVRFLEERHLRYFAVAWQIVVPYLLLFLEHSSLFSRTRADKKCYRRLRIALSWFNKFAMFAYAWASWVGLGTIAACFFPSFAKAFVGIILLASAYLYSSFVTYGHRIFGENHPSRLSLRSKLTILGILVFAWGATLWWTWHWRTNILFGYMGCMVISSLYVKWSLQAMLIVVVVAAYVMKLLQFVAAKCTKIGKYFLSYFKVRRVDSVGSEYDSGNESDARFDYKGEGFEGID